MLKHMEVHNLRISRVNYFQVGKFLYWSLISFDINASPCRFPSMSDFLLNHNNSDNTNN
jgi:hypothetical protein